MKIFFGIILTLTLLFGGYLLLRQTDSVSDTASKVEGNNVRIEDGKQIVEIRAKGGYLPRVSVAKSGVPTILRIDTSGTFDCSSSVRIPSKNISKLLPATGTTDIELGTLESGTLAGTCGMGMYPFEITVE